MNKFKEKVAMLPTSHEDYRQWFTEDGKGRIPFAQFLRGIESNLARGDGGYRYSARSRETIAAAFAAIWSELETGRIDFDPRARARAIDGLRQDVRKVDPQFASMLQTIVAGAEGADHA